MDADHLVVTELNIIILHPLISMHSPKQMLWDFSCGPFTWKTKRLTDRLPLLLGRHARLPPLIKHSKRLGNIVCSPC